MLQPLSNYGVRHSLKKQTMKNGRMWWTICGPFSNGQVRRLQDGHPATGLVFVRHLSSGGGPMSYRKSTQLPRKWELSWVLPVGLRKSRQWRLLESNQDNPYEDESADRSPARDVPSLALPTLEERRVAPQIDKSGPSHREQMDAVFRERSPSEEQHPSASTLVSAAIRRLGSGFTGNRRPRESLSAPTTPWIAPKVEDYLHGEAAVLLRSPDERLIFNPMARNGPLKQCWLHAFELRRPTTRNILMSCPFLVLSIALCQRLFVV